MTSHGQRSLLPWPALLFALAVAVSAACGGEDDGVPATPTTSSTAAAGTVSATRTAAASATLPPSPAATASATATQAPPVTPGSPPSATRPPGTSTLPISNLPPLPAGTHREDAPIDGLDVLVLESFPPQYLVKVQAGLPSGCARPAGYEATKSGSTITVRVYNSMPDGVVACTAIYGMYDLSINIGSDYQPGQNYTVRVNDRTATFTAQ